MRFERFALLPLTFGAAIQALPASAQSTGLEDMVGARAGQAENALQSRGYRFISAQQGDDRSYTYWWNADRRQCVTIATMDGRYASITPSPAPDCQQSASADRPRPGNDYRPRPDDGYRPQPGYRPGYRPDDQRPTTLPDRPPTIAGNAVDLGLVCFGDGARDGIATGTRWTWNPDRDHYDYGTYSEGRRETFDASLMIQLWNGGGRIRLPRSLVPPIHSRGDGNWWDLTDVRSGRDTITATYRLNGLNKPRVTIDRRTGRITVQGLSNYGFRGSCDEVGDGNRRF